MRFLVIGDSQDTASFCASLGCEGRHAWTHCADSGEALAELHSSPMDYQWVFLEKRGSCMESRNIARRIKAMAPQLPVTFLTHCDVDELAREASRPAVCAVERTEEGLQILRCALHTVRKPSAPSTDMATLAAGGRPWSFEYHAPCKVPSKN